MLKNCYKILSISIIIISLFLSLLNFYIPNAINKLSDYKNLIISQKNQPLFILYYDKKTNFFMIKNIKSKIYNAFLFPIVTISIYNTQSSNRTYFIITDCFKDDILLYNYDINGFILTNNIFNTSIEKLENTLNVTVKEKNLPLIISIDYYFFIIYEDFNKKIKDSFTYINSKKINMNMNEIILKNNTNIEFNNFIQNTFNKSNFHFYNISNMDNKDTILDILDIALNEKTNLFKPKLEHLSSESNLSSYLFEVQQFPNYILNILPDKLQYYITSYQKKHQYLLKYQDFYLNSLNNELFKFGEPYTYYDYIINKIISVFHKK